MSVRAWDVGAATLSIEQDLDLPYNGAHIWDASLVLSKYFENEQVFPKGYWKGKKVLELGAGTGLAGLSLAAMGASVTLTDIKPLLPLLEKNSQTNQPLLQGKVEVNELDWESPETAQVAGKYDVVIGSDLIHFPALWAGLLKTLTSMTAEGSSVLFAYEDREKNEPEFFKQLRRRFRYKRVAQDEMDPVFSSPDIKIVRISRRPSDATGTSSAGSRHRHRDSSATRHRDGSATRHRDSSATRQPRHLRRR